MRKLLLFVFSIAITSTLAYGQRTLIDFPLDSTVTFGACFGAGSLEPAGCFAVVLNPDTVGNSADSVGQYTEPAEGEPWMGMFFDITESATFQNDSSVISALVWVPDSASFTFKLENPTTGLNHEFPPIPVTTTSQWIKVSQDVAGSPADGQAASRIVIFFNIGSTPTSTNVFGFDDIVQEGARVGINDYAFANDLKIYPNPASDEIRFTTNGLPHTIQVFDMSGKLVREISNTLSDRLDIAELNKGFYLITVLDHKGRSGRTGKFVKL